MHIPAVMRDGNPNSPICIVGMGPSKSDLEANRPFTGPGGALLWGLAGRAGFSRADAYCLYTIADYPLSLKGTPTHEQFDKWWHQFDAAIGEFTGSVVLVLGADALWRTIGHTGILHWRGYLMPKETWNLIDRINFTTSYYKSNTKYHKKGDPKIAKVKSKVEPPLRNSVVYVVPSLDPESVREQGFKPVPALAYDIDRAWRATRNELVINDFSFDSTPQNLTLDHEAIAVDIETDFAPGTKTGYITRVGMANSKGAWSATWNLGTKEACERELSGIFDRWIVGHNLCFDIPELERHGVKCEGKLFDTMLAAQILQPDLFKGLNSAASLYLDVKRWKHLSEAQPELYNAHDVIATYYLFRILRDALKERGVYDHFVQTIMPTLRTLMELEREGLQLDIPRYREWQRTIDEQLDAIKSDFDSRYPGVHINSPGAVAIHLWDVLGPQLGAKLFGKRRSDETTLRRLAALYPDVQFFSLVLRYRELYEYKKRFSKLVPDARGRVYPSYAPGTKDDEFLEYGGSRIQYAKGIAGTGRIQAKDPSPQNLPKSSRAIVIPHTPGNVLLERDYDSAELRVVAGLSRDRQLMEAVNGPNIHLSHAERWGCTRDEAKTIVYATFYGAGPKKLQNVYLAAGKVVKEEWCAKLQNQFFSTYPDYAQWRAELIRTVQKTRSLVNPFGRPRYFWHTDRDVPAALDFLPQSTVADIVWSVLGHVAHVAKQYGGRLRTIVHDSFLFEFPPHNLAEADSDIKKTLERTFDNIAPGFYLPSKAKVGSNWFDLKPYVPTPAAEVSSDQS